MRADVGTPSQVKSSLTAAADGELWTGQMNEGVKPTETIRCHFLERHGLLDISISVHTL